MQPLTPLNVATYISRFQDAIVGPDAFIPMMYPRNDCMSFDVFLNPGVNFNFRPVNDQGGIGMIFLLPERVLPQDLDTAHVKVEYDDLFIHYALWDLPVDEAILILEAKNDGRVGITAPADKVLHLISIQWPL